MTNWGLAEDGRGAAMDAVLARRTFLSGLGIAGAALALPGCATTGALSYVGAVRTLLTLATQRAFATLTAPDGFWDSSVARIGLPTLFGHGGSVMSKLLTSTLFRDQLQHQLNRYAEDGARRAAPLVAESLRSVSIPNALGLVRGGPTAATSFLRQQLGAGLVNAMIPELGGVMSAANDPVLARALGALTGVNVSDAAHALALEADNAIWYQVGAEETHIRENPQSTNDPVLIAALAAAKL